MNRHAQSSFNNVQKVGLLHVAGIDGNGRRLRDFDLDTPAPRVGLAYALTSTTKPFCAAASALPM